MHQFVRNVTDEWLIGTRSGENDPSVKRASRGAAPSVIVKETLYGVDGIGLPGEAYQCPVQCVSSALPELATPPLKCTNVMLSNIGRLAFRRKTPGISPLVMRHIGGAGT